MSRSPSSLLLNAPRSVRTRLAWLVAAVALSTAVGYPLRLAVPDVSLGVVYLVGVLLVATNGGFWWGLVCAVCSAAALNWFHLPPTGQFHLADGQNWVALGVYVVAGAIGATVADAARTRADDAERRRQEALLAAELARVLLGDVDLDTALSSAARRLAAALEADAAAIELRPLQNSERRTALPLDLGSGRCGTLVVPPARAKLAELLVPTLEPLLTAALDRAQLQAEVVEAQALRRSDVIKTTLLRAISHDLRTPLTAILAAGEALGAPDRSREERAELSAVVVEEAGRLSHLVTNLLELSRLQAGAAEPRRDWLSIDEVLRAAAEPYPGVRLSLDDGLPLLRADAAQLERAFANLFENASRYGAGAPVKVRARVVGDRLVVRVIDRGPGIAVERLERIFEAFEREPGTEGSGLGLAIVRGFIEANGGRVHAESLPGQGATFVVSLPVEQVPAVALT